MALLFAAIQPLEASQPAPLLGCGKYLASGRLRADSRTNFILNLHPDSLEPYELLIANPSYANPEIPDLEEAVNTLVQVEFIVPQPIRHSPLPFVILTKLTHSRQNAPANGTKHFYREDHFHEPLLIQPLPCGQTR